MLLAITKLPEMRDRSVVRSSVMPSAKYSCSGSLDRFAKGSTTIDKRGATIGCEIEAAGDFTATGKPATASGRNAYTRTGRAMFLTLCSPMSSNW